MKPPEMNLSDFVSMLETHGFTLLADYKDGRVTTVEVLAMNSHHVGKVLVFNSNCQLVSVR